MKTLGLVLASISMLGLATVAWADEPKKDDTAAKLLGKWEVTKCREESLVGAIVTFTKDGKVSLTRKVDGKETTLDGAYKVEKDKLISNLGDNTDTNTIKKLTADALELENDQATAITVLKKKK